MSRHQAGKIVVGNGGGGHGTMGVRPEFVCLHPEAPRPLINNQGLMAVFDGGGLIAF